MSPATTFKKPIADLEKLLAESGPEILATDPDQHARLKRLVTGLKKSDGKTLAPDLKKELMEIYRWQLEAQRQEYVNQLESEERRLQQMPTAFRNSTLGARVLQDISVAKAKKAIADYKKAIGRPEGLAELSIYYCEEVCTFLGYCGMDDEGYYSALVRMFGQALKATMALPEPQRDDFLDRLESIRIVGQGYGWGVGDDFNWLWEKAGLEIHA